MKILIVGFTILLHLTATAQSPGLTINVIMDSVKAEFTRYKIEMKICKPKKMTERGSWFSHDTSTIDFAALKANEIDCGAWFDKGMGEPLTYNKEEVPFNKFQFSNQVFAWENIYVFRISDWSSRGWNPEMYIVIPVKYKSFRTHIDITDVEYLSGKCVFLTNTNALYDESKLNIRQSLKNEKGVEVKNFPLAKLLEQK
jgi:hypothetical protein